MNSEINYNLQAEVINVIYIDKEKKEFDNIKNYTDLNSFIDEHRKAGKKNYVLVDEIQDIEKCLGYEIVVGQLQTNEIDFVCTKPEGNRIYVQASYIKAYKDTHDREFGNLHVIKDNYLKYVNYKTPLVTNADDDGVTHIHLRKFLLKGLDR